MNSLCNNKFSAWAICRDVFLTMRTSGGEGKRKAALVRTMKAYGGAQVQLHFSLPGY